MIESVPPVVIERCDPRPFEDLSAAAVGFDVNRRVGHARRLDIMTEILFKIGITIGILIAIAFEGAIVVKVWRSQIDPWATAARIFDKIRPDSAFIATRDPNKIYQDHKPVGDVPAEPVDQGERKVFFKELTNTGALDQKREFEYRRGRYMILNFRVFTGTRSVMAVGPSGSTRSEDKDVMIGVTCEVQKR